MSMYILYLLITLASIAGILIITLCIVSYRLHKRLRRLTAGTDGKNLEDAIYQLNEDHHIFAHRVAQLEKTTGRIDAEMNSAIRGVATVRYNAFSDVGGKQSFATAFLSADGNGVVVSSIYTRERVNVYAKPIVQFTSEYELSSEEARSLKEAHKNL